MSALEEKFARIWQAMDGAPFERELQFHPKRKWRFDFAWPDVKVAVEIEGGTFAYRSRHTTGTGFHKDCEKYNAAVMEGWLVLRLDSKMVNGSQLQAIRDFVELRSVKCADGMEDAFNAPDWIISNPDH